MHGVALHGLAWFGEARFQSDLNHSGLLLGGARPGTACLGDARIGKACLGGARQGEARYGPMTEKFFLDESDWRAFNRYSTPREAADSASFRQDHLKTNDTVCWFCGLRGTDANPLQAAHRIPAQAAANLALKPEVLSRSDNFVWAHRRICNDAVELPLRLVMRRLMAFGVKELPAFLPKEILKTWSEESTGVFEPLPVAVTQSKRSRVAPAAFPQVPPQTFVKRVEPKVATGKPSLPAPSSVKKFETTERARFPAVPPQSVVRRKPPRDGSSEKEDER